MDVFIVAALFILALLVGFLLAVRKLSAPPPSEVREPEEKRFRRLQQEQREPISQRSPNSRPPASIRPPVSIRPSLDPGYDQQIACLTATSALDALLIRLPLEKQKEVARTIVQFLGNALHSGSRLTKREKEDIGVLGWLHLLDTLRQRCLILEEKDEYILVSHAKVKEEVANDA